MTTAKYDVLGIGNAIFDILVQTDEKFLATHGMTKGGMALIDEVRAISIYQSMGPATEMSGGSAANTIVGVANLGARAAYVGKVRDDQMASLHDIAPRGCIRTKPALGWPCTGCPHSGARARLHEHYRRGAGCIRRYRRRPSGISIYLEGYLGSKPGPS